MIVLSEPVIGIVGMRTTFRYTFVTIRGASPRPITGPRPSPSAACAPAQGPYILQRLRQTELVNKRGLPWVPSRAGTKTSRRSRQQEITKSMDNSDPAARRLLPRLGRHEKPNSLPGLVLATATALSLVHAACGDAVSPPPDPPPPEPARPAAIAVISGNNQSSHGDESLPDPIVVGVRDQYGSLMSGIAVTFIPQSGHGRTDPSASTTDAEGRASTQWTLGNFAGQQVLNVAVHNGPTATVHADALQPRPKASILTTTAMAAEGDSLHLTIQLSDTVSDTIEIRYTIGGDGDGATAGRGQR